MKNAPHKQTTDDEAFYNYTNLVKAVRVCCESWDLNWYEVLAQADRLYFTEKPRDDEMGK